MAPVPVTPPHALKRWMDEPDNGTEVVASADRSNEHPSALSQWQRERDKPRHEYSQALAHDAHSGQVLATDAEPSHASTSSQGFMDPDDFQPEEYLSDGDRDAGEQDGDELWEDEVSSSSGSEFEEDESVTTRGATPAGDGTLEEGTSPRGQTAQTSKAQSYRNALQQYKQSRRALMLSNTEPTSSAHSSEPFLPLQHLGDADERAAGRQYEPTQEAGRRTAHHDAQARSITPLSTKASFKKDLQLPTDPFSRLSEAVDDATPVQRAHDIRFDKLHLPRTAKAALPSGLADSHRESNIESGSNRADAVLEADVLSAPRGGGGDVREATLRESSNDTLDQSQAQDPRGAGGTSKAHVHSRAHSREDPVSAADHLPGSPPAAHASAASEHFQERNQPRAGSFAQQEGAITPRTHSPPSAYHSDESIVSDTSRPDAEAVHWEAPRRADDKHLIVEPNTPLAARRASPVEVSTPRPSSHSQSAAALNTLPLVGSQSSLSLWDYLREEIVATDFDSTQEMKWERVTNFIAIPFWMERIMVFGIAVCLDSFLYTFTILPLRFGVALYVWTANLMRWCLGGERRYLHSSHKCDLLKAALIVLSCYILSRVTDASKMYHSVRGQDFVKLSVIFNVLEIADRLCCSFGQDLLDSLFSRATLARRKDGRQPYLRPTGFFLLSLAYILAHTFVLFYQLVTLNVAIMSYDNALLTLLISNQFVEIKGSVFKKFEKENLFQLTCADIVERFQLGLMLSAIALRNLIEMSGISASIEGGTGPLPTSFTVFPSLNMLETIIVPVAIVLASECIVDWLKHAFITKFNHIRPAVYGRFVDVLCRDLVAGPGSGQGSRKHNFVDQSPIVSRRLGFAALPLACLLIRITSQILGMLRDTSHFDECAAPHASQSSFKLVYGIGLARGAARMLGAHDPEGAANEIAATIARSAAWALTVVIGWVFLVGLKLLLGLNLVSYASHRYATMQQREQEEELNARDRAPIGVDREERLHDAKIAQLLDRAEDDAGSVGMRGQVAPARGKVESGGGGGGGSSKSSKGPSLMDVSRYSMIKSRIW
ncbi:Predicted membrane protein [Ceraceosorus bombacis]|uniref:Predicted membrane protein n=1 Tax=Ceraceosorus bombacis TaxID=401625 RepID=A0A0P1BR89_9BASI|nr:Predicted membrane protein [Ceraceosorus bombacis]